MIRFESEFTLLRLLLTPSDAGGAKLWHWGPQTPDHKIGFRGVETLVLIWTEHKNLAYMQWTARINKRQGRL